MSIRLGLGVRIMSLFVLGVLLYSGVVQGKAGWISISSSATAFILAIYIWTYKTCVTESGISVRYFPLVEIVVRWSDLIRVVESVSPLCVAQNTRFRIWGLTPKTRTAFLDLVPRHLLVPEPDRPPDIALREAKKYWRVTKIVGSLFVLGVGLLIPFLDNNPLNRYWQPFGRVIVLAVGGLWLALVFTAGMAYIHWRVHRDLGNQSHPRASR